MGQSKLREFLLDLGSSAELRIHQHQNGSKPVAAAISLTTSVAISKSQRKKQKKKRSLLKKVGITPDGERRREVETIVFKNSSGKAASNSGNSRKDKQSGADDAEPIDIRKASFEVMKFSINAMKGSEKEDAETKLAISLGAEPPKNKYLNYKDLQQIRVAEKQAKEIQDKNSVKPDLKPRVNKKAQNRPSSSGNGKSRTNQRSNKIMKRPFKSKMKNAR
jgi:hypothetical protein